MAASNRGEVWLVDLGYAAKIRPCLVLSSPILDQDRAVVAYVAHTTTLRGTQYEVELPVKFLKPGAFDAQNLVVTSLAKSIRKLGDLSPDHLAKVEVAVRRWLGL